MLSLAAATIKKQTQRICLFSVPNSNKKSGKINREIESDATEKVDRKYFPRRPDREETLILLVRNVIFQANHQNFTM